MTLNLDVRASALARGEEPRPAPVSDHDVLRLALQGAAVLFANGETTERTVAAAARIAAAHGRGAIVLPRWGELTVRTDADPGALHDVVAVTPAGIDMNKVLETERAIAAIESHELPLEAAASTFR